MITVCKGQVIINTENELFQKFSYIAQYDGQTVEEEMKEMIKAWVRAFEECEGVIYVKSNKYP